MPLHAIQFRSNLLDRPDHVVQVPLLMLLVARRIRGKLIIVFERKDTVIGIGVEQRPEHLGIGGCALGPLVP